MKFTVAAFKLLAALATTTTCFAQRVSIVSPANDTSVTPGQSISVGIEYDIDLNLTAFSVNLWECSQPEDSSLPGIFRSFCNDPDNSAVYNFSNTLYVFNSSQIPRNASSPSTTLEQRLSLKIPSYIDKPLPSKIAKGPKQFSVSYYGYASNPIGIEAITLNITSNVTV